MTFVTIAGKSPKMSKPYDFVLFLGRFQPFHNGHQHVVNKALCYTDNVICGIGSARSARRPRNPWTWGERAAMLPSNVISTPIRDFTYREDRWVQGVQDAVHAIAHPRHKAPRIAIISKTKEGDDDILKYFPNWTPLPVLDGPTLNATDIRKAYFEKGSLQGVPASTEQFLAGWHGGKDHRYLKEWMKFCDDYKVAHDSGEFHRNNVTGDALVLCGGMVLMVVRKDHPGKGMLALPGGHLKPKETAIGAAIRELQEETGIVVSPRQVERVEWFDDPYRSDLCRTVTACSLIRLDSVPPLVPGDDAADCRWVPLNRIFEDECFDDHYHIIDKFIGLG